MTMRSKQWYTNTSRLPNSFVNVSIGRPPLIQSRQQDHRSDGRGSQNFKYVWLEFRSYKKDRSPPPIDWQQEPTAPTLLTNWYDVVWNSSREEEPYEKQMAGCQPSLYCFPAERGAAQRPSLVCRRIRQQETHQGHR